MKGHHSKFQIHWIWCNQVQLTTMKIHLLVLSVICLGGVPGSKGSDSPGLWGAPDAAIKNNQELWRSVGGGWYIGEVRASCDTSCQNLGLICTEDGLKSHNHEVDSPEKVLELVKSLNGGITTTSCPGYYGQSADTPTISAKKNICYSSAANKLSFSCSAKHDNFEDKQRLCYCHPGWVF